MNTHDFSLGFIPAGQSEQGWLFLDQGDGSLIIFNSHDEEITVAWTALMNADGTAFKGNAVTGQGGRNLYIAGCDGATLQIHQDMVEEWAPILQQYYEYCCKA